MTEQELLTLVDVLLPQEPNPTMYLATYDGLFPRVRPMSLVRDELRFYMGTGREDAKSVHIRAHPQVEFIIPLPRGVDTGYLRVAGMAVEITGRAKSEARTRGKGYDVTAYAAAGWTTPRSSCSGSSPGASGLSCREQWERKTCPWPGSPS